MLIDDDFISPFLDKERLLQSDVGFVIYDGFPVTEGHCLVVPHRIYADYFESTTEEISGLNSLVFETRKLLVENYSPDGFNIGINCGCAAGHNVVNTFKARLLECVMWNGTVSSSSWSCILA